MADNETIPSGEPVDTNASNPGNAWAFGLGTAIGIMSLIINLAAAGVIDMTPGSLLIYCLATLPVTAYCAIQAIRKTSSPMRWIVLGSAAAMLFASIYLAYAMDRRLRAGAAVDSRISTATGNVIRPAAIPTETIVVPDE